MAVAAYNAEYMRWIGTGADTDQVHMMCYYLWCSLIKEVVRMNTVPVIAGYFGPVLHVYKRVQKCSGMILQELYALEGQDPVGPEGLMSRFLDLAIENDDVELVRELLFGRFWMLTGLCENHFVKYIMCSGLDDDRIVDWMICGCGLELSYERIEWAIREANERGKHSVAIALRQLV